MKNAFYNFYYIVRMWDRKKWNSVLLHQIKITRYSHFSNNEGKLPPLTLMSEAFGPYVLLLPLTFFFLIKLENLIGSIKWKTFCSRSAVWKLRIQKHMTVELRDN